MADVVNVSVAANDGGGDPLRGAMIKINERFQQMLGTLSGRGLWQTGASYAVLPARDWAIFNGEAYVCAIAHTAGVFATDLAAGRWASIDALDLRLDLANDTDPLKGPALVGYRGGTVKARLDRAPYVNNYFLAAEADATAMIQRAFNSGEKTIEFDPAVTYTISAEITVPFGLHIKGNEAQVLTAGNHRGFNFAGGGSCRNLKAKRTAGAAYVAGSTAFYCSGVKNTGAAPTYTTAPKFIDNTIEGFGDYGIFLAYCKKGQNFSNEISGVGYTGIGGISCEDIETHGNKIHDIVQGSPGGDSYGIFFDRADGTTELEDPRSYRCQIHSNNIWNIRTAGAATNGHAIDTHGGVDISIYGNTVTNCEGGIYLTASSIAGLQALACQRCSITNNIINSIGGYVSYAILVYGARNATVVAEYATDCTVSGNTVDGHGQLTNSTVPAMSMSYTRNLRVSAGTFRESGGSCIRLDKCNYGFAIEGVTMIDPVSTTYASASCILVGDDENQGLIGGNTYVFENAAAGTFVAVNAVRVDAGLTGLDLNFAKSHFQGISATRLQTIFATTTGVRTAGLDERRGSGVITLGAGSNTAFIDVTFDKRMPYPPRMNFNLLFPHLQGGVCPVLSSRGFGQSNAPTTTGFRVYATSSNGANFPAGGDVEFEWEAR